jgi:hypothetical protein
MDLINFFCILTLILALYAPLYNGQAIRKNPIRNGLFFWKIKGNCDVLNGTCSRISQIPDSACRHPVECFKMMQSQRTLDTFFAIQLVPNVP